MSEWIEWKWTVEKPYPASKEKPVSVKFRSVEIDINDDLMPSTVEDWNWEDKDSMYDIVAYRLA